eukprot:TRINITY_DN53035_c0_g1_i1.p1 TRINITY_DN53035_c0_g1~~TRINITY_DN53035_c0_g1_i1.p1  ORF type:complete len:309 (-),score=62.31 TRINITY_DN53035_c0_g1_i1:26-952(-)
MMWAAFLLCLCPALCSGEDCCSDILIDSANHSSDVHAAQGSRLGFYRQLGHFGSRPAYRQRGGDFYLYYQESHKEWITSSYYFGSSDGNLNNDVPSYCVEKLDNWMYHNGSGITKAGKVVSTCAAIEDTCCKDILVSSANSASVYPEYSLLGLGTYSAVGIRNGRYLYQRRGMDRYLEYHNNNQWMITTGVGKAPGYFNHEGGTVCAEHAKEKWKFGSFDDDNKWVWTSDAQLEITCMENIEKGTLEAHKDEKKVVDKSYSFNAGYLTVLVLFILLILAICLYFARRLHRSWSKGVQGTQLIKETFDA